MKGDFSRIRFNPNRQYTAVLEQQGRVSVDADANEQVAIDGHARRTINRDVIGLYGGPEDDCGFVIEIVNNEIRIGRGRYYVDGLLVENRSASTFDAQPYLLDPHLTSHDLLQQLFVAQADAVLQVSLEVWQRLVTSLDDPCLLDPAIGQCDPTARLQTVSRVVARLVQPSTPQTAADGTGRNTSGSIINLINKFGAASLATEHTFAPIAIPAGKKVGVLQQGPPAAVHSVPVLETGPPATVSTAPPATCCDSMYAAKQTASTGTLRVELAASGDECGCDPIATAGYRGLENQLYRVEIHTGGDLSTATFKWSRENASVVAAVLGVQGQVVNVSTLGPDANLGFQPGQWVELTDDTDLFALAPNRPGALYQIQSIEPASLSVTMTTVVVPIDSNRNARMRRWDQFGPTAGAAGVPLTATVFAMEYGIEVTFSPGTYASGDYWTIPARTASGQIDWPPCGSDGNPFQPAHNITVYSAPLACIHLGPGFKPGAVNLQLQTEANRAAIAAGSFNRVSTPAAPTAVTTSRSRLIVDDCRRKFPPLTRLSDARPGALHINSTSWANDAAMTVDQLLANGLSLVLDQAADSPWTGANFQLMLEIPTNPLQDVANLGFFAPAKNSFNVFRQVLVLDPPDGITTNATTVTWLPPLASNKDHRTLFELGVILNQLLQRGAQSNAFGRVRVRLLGEAIYKSTASGPIYLDGSSFGKNADTTSRDTTIALGMPTGSMAAAADFHSWFYLAPTVEIDTVSITPQGVIVTVDFRGNKTGLMNAAGQPITEVDAFVTLTYAPAADTPITLMLTGPGVGALASIAPNAIIQAGATSVKVPITIDNSPGHGKSDNFQLFATINTFNGPVQSGPATLTVTGGDQPPAPIN